MKRGGVERATAGVDTAERDGGRRIDGATARLLSVWSNWQLRMGKEDIVGRREEQSRSAADNSKQHRHAPPAGHDSLGVPDSACSLRHAAKLAGGRLRALCLGEPGVPVLDQPIPHLLAPRSRWRWRRVLVHARALSGTRHRGTSQSQFPVPSSHQEHQLMHASRRLPSLINASFVLLYAKYSEISYKKSLSPLPTHAPTPQRPSVCLHNKNDANRHGMQDHPECTQPTPPLSANSSQMTSSAAADPNAF